MGFADRAIIAIATVAIAEQERRDGSQSIVPA